LKSRSAAVSCYTEVCYLSVEAREPLAVKRREFITLLGGAEKYIPLTTRVATSFGFAPGYSR